MSIPIFQVDAFTETLFAGNPAAVCLLEAPAQQDWMQAVAAEMNLSETAFVRRREEDGFDLRWFTPKAEVSLCGHATLATSHTLWEQGWVPQDQGIRFHTKSGVLQARRLNDRIELDFPSVHVEACDPPTGLLEALGLESAQCSKKASRPSYLVEVNADATVRSLSPDFARLHQMGIRSVIVTAQSDEPGYDIVSRFFAPGVGVDEDPVTGSAHCTLTPYWSARLGKNTLSAYQASPRGGSLRCELVADRVKIAGKAITVLRGSLVN